MRAVSYITVTSHTDSDSAGRQAQQVGDKLADGYEILSAVSDGRAVHYILVKEPAEKRQLPPHNDTVKIKKGGFA